MDVNYNLWIKKKKPRVWWKSDKYFVVLYKNLMVHNRILVHNFYILKGFSKLVIAFFTYKNTPNLINLKL